MVKAYRSGEERGKVKLRFVEFELEGTSSTIEESIKNIVVGAMNRGVVATVAPPRIQANRQRGSTKEGASNNNPQSELAFTEDSDVEESPDGESDGTGDLKPKRGPHYPVPKFMGDVDLDSGEKPFKEFANEINPQTDNHKYIVISAWFKQFRSLNSITVDHVYTCYQKMNWKSQKDVGQPFRKMKQRSWFENPSRGLWQLTHIGLDKVRDASGVSD